MARAEGVHPMRAIGIRFAGVDGRPCRRVDDRIGPERGDRAQHRIAVADIESVVAQSGELVLGCAIEARCDLPAHLPTGAGYEDAHQLERATAVRSYAVGERGAVMAPGGVRIIVSVS